MWVSLKVGGGGGCCFCEPLAYQKKVSTNFPVFLKVCKEILIELKIWYNVILLFHCIPKIRTFDFGEGHLIVKFGVMVRAFQLDLQGEILNRLIFKT